MVMSDEAARIFRDIQMMTPNQPVINGGALVAMATPAIIALNNKVSDSRI